MSIIQSASTLLNAAGPTKREKVKEAAQAREAARLALQPSLAASKRAQRAPINSVIFRGAK